MTKDKILVVEDDRDLSFIACTQLEEMGYLTEAAYSGEDAKESLNSEQFDIILLDMMLQDTTGIELCREIRKKVYCPIIFVSCIGEQETVIEALKEGGDDYIVKPVNFGELQARIEANLRRKREYDRKTAGKEQLVCGSFALNMHTHNLILEDSTEISLSPIEYKLVTMFLEHENELLLYEELYRCIWESDDLGDVRTVMVHVSNLRKKMEQIRRECIQTVRGAGYIFNSR
ncbi:MAG: response regulator transcription factor [Lachnospiraceae bacterium]|nr:response regulator transcription factor [Lachnospiraceae bacterium]